MGANPRLSRALVEAIGGPALVHMLVLPPRRAFSRRLLDFILDTENAFFFPHYFHTTRWVPHYPLGTVTVSSSFHDEFP